MDDIIRAGFFENKNNLCKTEATILVYKKIERNYSELQSYVKEGTCSY